MAQFLLGAIALGSLVVALFFLRFWRRTGDRFFLFFAISFAVEAVARVVMALYPELSEDQPAFYAVRIIEYGLILVAIWQKNRPLR